ncbi:MAG: hypothetical protein IKZ87_06090 [Actinomycetaceae bacterium]|nr:hypothetical protein [Actinomycetaceae bacterium]
MRRRILALKDGVLAVSTLIKAHQKLDKYIDQLYSGTKKWFGSDAERLEFLAQNTKK